MEVKVYQHRVKQSECNNLGQRTRPLDPGSLAFAQLALQIAGAKMWKERLTEPQIGQRQHAMPTMVKTILSPTGKIWKTTPLQVLTTRRGAKILSEEKMTVNE
jgi:hypothetical protein